MNDIIIIDKTILHNTRINHNMFLTYIGLALVFNPRNYAAQYISLDMLAYALYANTQYTKYTKNDLKDGLQGLIDIEIINVIQEMGIGKYIIDITQIGKVMSNNQIFIDIKNIHQICNLRYKSKHTLLRYYINMLYTIDANISYNVKSTLYSNFVGHKSIAYLAQLSHISPQTAMDFNEVLEQNQLVYIYRHPCYKNPAGKIWRLKNHYGKYHNKKIIEKYASNYYELARKIQFDDFDTTDIFPLTMESVYKNKETEAK